MIFRNLVRLALYLACAFVTAFIVSRISGFLTGTNPKTDFWLIMGSYLAALGIALVMTAIKRRRIQQRGDS